MFKLSLHFEYNSQYVYGKVYFTEGFFLPKTIWGFYTDTNKMMLYLRQY